MLGICFKKQNEYYKIKLQIKNTMFVVFFKKVLFYVKIISTLARQFMYAFLKSFTWVWY